jgi:hypothetical protein
VNVKRRRGPDPDRHRRVETIGGPAAVAARDRVEAELDRLGHATLQVLVVAPPDAQRLAARDRGRAAAIAAGRGGLLDQSMSAARDATLRIFARSAFSGTWAFTDMAMSVTNAQDRVATAAAFEEAAMAAVVEDLVDGDTLEVLRSTSHDLARLTGVPQPLSIGNVGSAATAIRNPAVLLLVWVVVVFLFLTGIVRV